MLGERIGSGATAEVYAWGERDVIKLYRAGREWLAHYEAQLTRAAHEAGAPAPEVRGVVEVEGRVGLVLARHRGESLLELLLSGATSAESGGETLAAIHHRLHSGTREVAGVLRLEDWLALMFRRLGEGGFAGEVLQRARRVADGLAPGAVLCHGDLHPGNVLMTEAGPLAIDWTSAVVANPLLDLARVQFTFTLALVPREMNERYGEAWLTRLRRSLYDAYERRYAELARTPREELRAQLRPWLLVMATMALGEGPREQDDALAEFLRGAPL